MGGRRGLSRRDFLRGTLRGRDLALAATGALGWSFVVSQSTAAAAALRPPGAHPEADFLARCIKCGQCAEACPFDTLKLATLGGEGGVGVPWFEPREIPCYMCEDGPCIAACPTDALIPDTAIEDARMGLAVLIDQESCLAFQGLRCEVCYRACPLLGESIRLEMRPQERTGKHAYFLPVVDSEHCTGCGRCENACILEEAAIKVLPRDVAKGRLGEHYRFGWKEDAEISRDVTAPESAPEGPGWDSNLKDVLERLDDLSGIEEP